jgi:hypothetical protein
MLFPFYLEKAEEQGLFRRLYSENCVLISDGKRHDPDQLPLPFAFKTAFNCLLLF